MNEQEQDPIKELIAIAERIRELNPVDKDGEKYVSLHLSGAGKHPRNVHVYFDSDLAIEVSSMPELLEKIAAYSPKTAKQSRIDKLKAELDQLKAELAELEAE